MTYQSRRYIKILVLMLVILAIVSMPKINRTAVKLSEEPTETGQLLQRSPRSLKDRNQFHFDPEDLTLDRMQCRTYLPQLYMEIERGIRFWTTEVNITAAAIESAGAQPFCSTLQVRDAKLYVKTYNPGGTTRAKAIIQQVASVLHSMPIHDKRSLPDSEFVVCVADDGVHREQAGRNGLPAFVLARHRDDRSTIAIPEFGFYSWAEPKVGAFHHVRANAINFDQTHPWHSKIPRAFWKGAVNGIDPAGVRANLLSVSNGKVWSEISTMSWNRLKPGEPLPMWEHCKYKYLVHAEGVTYSGRLKYLLQCASVIIMHKPDWIQHFHHLLVTSGDNQNVVQIAGPAFTGLGSSVESLLDDDELACKIVRNAVSQFRDKYLSPAATECYWRELLHSWGSIQYWNVSVSGSASVEDFNLMNTVTWNIR